MQKNEIEEKQSKNIQWISFFSHPAVGIIGALSSILGILLAIYFYNSTIEKPFLTYIIHPIRASVVKAGEISNMKVFFKGREIYSDINIVQCSIWNAGKKPIKDIDILEPIVLFTDNSVPILEASIRKTSRDVISLRLNDNNMPSGKIGISWKIMEQNDGGVIQIIYAGNPETKFKISGVLIGQNNFQQIAFPYMEIKSPTQQYKIQVMDRYGGLLLIILGIILLIFIATNYYMLRKRNKDDIITVRGHIIALVIPLVLIILGIYLIYLYGFTKQIFDF